MPDTDNKSYQRQPAPGQQIDPRNPPVAHQPPEQEDDLDEEPADPAAKKAVACDYIDVVRLAGTQPRFLLQPHLSGGAVAAPAMLLEIRGARALVQHLNHVIQNG